MGIYEFERDDAFRFASHIGARAFEHGDELFFKTCPYCHGQGRANEKSFSINLNTGLFKCFRSSCGRSGNMIDLARDFDFQINNTVSEYYAPKKRYRRLTAPKEPIKPKDPAIEYLNSRGISKEIAEKYQITVQTDHPNVLCMPFFDEVGQLQFIKYRKTDYNKDRDNNKEWCEKDCKPILYGMWQCNTENKTLIVTEGQLDSLSVAEAGYENAVSVPTGSNGFTWVPYCWDFVNKFERIIVFGDHEKGHITLLDEFKKRFDAKVYHVREEDYKDCKDANDILRKYGKEQIKECIENAIQDPLSYLLKMSDIKDVNIYDIEKLKTGVRCLDYPMYGGIPFPGVAIITGKRGEGKSTLASQIIANAIDQGYVCLAYSGELPGWQFKAGMVKQIAGGEHTFLYKTKDGIEGYETSKANKELITAWMDDHIYIMDNAEVGSEDTIGILDAIETTIKRYGARVILLDNLMTALSAMAERSSEKYEQQSRFTKELSKMAMKYNVLILLVAHKRKNSYGGGDEMDDVMGAGDITNLATVIMSYGRDPELGESQRKLKLLKNRLFGKTNLAGEIMDFDIRSNRIYGPGDDKNRSYGWMQEQMTEATDDCPFT